MDIYVSSGAFGLDTLDATLDRARDWGVERVELTAGMRPFGEPLAALRAQGDLHLMLHNYFPPPPEPFVLNLASEDADTLETSRDHCRRAIAISGAIGAPVFGVHAGFAARVRPEHLGRGIPAERRTDRGRALEIFTDSVRGLIPHARTHGVRLCIENNVVEPANLVDGANPMLLLAVAEEMVAFVTEIDDPAVGLLLDVGHANTTCRSLGLDRDRFLDIVAPHTAMLHLSDNDGTRDSNEPFGPDAWFLPALAAFDCSIAVIEAYGLTRATLETCMASVRAAS